jgi:hypothetical protein
MKNLFSPALLALVTAAFIFSGCNATPTAPAPHSTPAVAAGEFNGEWRGQDQSTGALRLKIAPGKEGGWTGSVVFTYGPVDIPTTVKSVRVDGKKVEAVFTWEIEGTSASTKLVGELNGDQLEGTYDSTTGEGAAAGKWKATRVPARS